VHGFFLYPAAQAFDLKLLATASPALGAFTDIPPLRCVFPLVEDKDGFKVCVSFHSFLHCPRSNCCCPPLLPLFLSSNPLFLSFILFRICNLRSHSLAHIPPSKNSLIICFATGTVNTGVLIAV
jgi:hypothetical protein